MRIHSVHGPRSTINRMFIHVLIYQYAQLKYD